MKIIPLSTIFNENNVLFSKIVPKINLHFDNDLNSLVAQLRLDAVKDNISVERGSFPSIAHLRS